MEIKKSSETNQKYKSSEISITNSKECVSCKHILPEKLDRDICPVCGIKNR